MSIQRINLGVSLMALAFSALLLVVVDAKKEEDCEVCKSVLTKVVDGMEETDKSKEDKIGEAIREYCGGIKGKDQKFCFYIGALPESATSIMSNVQKPLSYRMPVEKVCEKLKKMDQQICELKYDKAIDWKTVDLNKLRVKELKKILDDWGQRCSGCTEKNEFVQMIKEHMPKHVKMEL